MSDEKFFCVHPAQPLIESPVRGGICVAQDKRESVSAQSWVTSHKIQLPIPKPRDSAKLICGKSAVASYCKLKQAIAAYCRELFRKNILPRTCIVVVREDWWPHRVAPRGIKRGAAFSRQFKTPGGSPLNHSFKRVFDERKPMQISWLSKTRPRKTMSKNTRFVTPIARMNANFPLVKIRAINVTVFRFAPLALWPFAPLR